MTPNTKLLISLSVGLFLGAGAVSMFQSPAQMADNGSGDEKKPLYWVAPMDANYRRDKPGKSPMGMDLIPVYEEGSGDDGFGPGAVKIAPHVINNLGVRTAPVEVANIHSQVKTVGYVQYDEDKLVHIHPRVEGWIEKLFIKAEGNPVEKGAPLYTLYSPQLVNAQEEFIIALKRNDHGLIDGAKERLRALHLSDGFIRRLEENRKVQQSVTFYAPQSGVVDALKTREGFFVKPGNTLMSIGQLEQVWVEAEVFERDAALISSQQPVSMTLDYLPGKSWNGVVDYVYPTLNAKTRTLRVRLKFENTDLQLKPNMFAQISIHANSIENAMLVPKEAVIRTGEQDRVVLALGEGQFKSVAVSIGRVTSDRIEILEGLYDTDEVVTSAQFLIDSESSKNSDFKRMIHDEEPSAVWMEGEVNSVMRGHNMVNITHGPAEAWGWPDMTMDFSVSEKVDINELAPGQSLHFEVTKTDEGGYTITGIHIMGEATNEVPSATVNGVINAISPEGNVFNISRDAIAKWDRPAATMDFVIAEGVDTSELVAGMSITFTFEVQSDLVITQIQNLSEGDAHDMPEQQSSSQQDHSGH